MYMCRGPRCRLYTNYINVHARCDSPTTHLHQQLLPPPPPPLTPPPPTAHPFMLLVNDLNTRLAQLDQILPKLSLLDQINDKMDSFEKCIRNLQQEITEVRQLAENNKTTNDKQEEHHYSLESRVRELEKTNDNLMRENNDLHEDFLKLQTHSMKYNLIFNGIEGTDDNLTNENTEEVLKGFIRNELGVEDAESIHFQNVHRLRKRKDGKPRGIVARFTRYTDRDRVLRTVPVKLRDKRQFSVSQQFPIEIARRRDALYPIMKEHKRRGVKAVINYDRLYVNGSPYTAPEPGYPHAATLPPDQRNRP